MDRASGVVTAAYVRDVAGLAYFWGWPMVNLHNRMDAFRAFPGPGLMGGVVPVAPPNRIAMLHDYVTPEERLVACPNQDVVYGFGSVHAGGEPAVVQVPDFGDRFWVYQLCDQRTDSFARIGKMYGTEFGNYLVVARDWAGDVPDGITDVLRCPTDIGICIPRVFLNDTDEDRAAIQPLINQIAMYPLSEFDGTTKTIDWKQATVFPSQVESQAETRWVFPDKFADHLADVLEEVPPMAGEEAMYDTFRFVLDAVRDNDELRAAFDEGAESADRELVTPLFQFHNYGQMLSGNWTTLVNNSEFGTDYYSRTAAAKSNIFVNKPAETRYFYADLDSDGERLNGANSYIVNFPALALPPVRGFWSLTLYNEHHFFHPNELNRYSLGTKNTTLVTNADGSLTLYAQTQRPEDDRFSNWLPAPDGDFTLYLRAYWPGDDINTGGWNPPPIERT